MLMFSLMDSFCNSWNFLFPFPPLNKLYEAFNSGTKKLGYSMCKFQRSLKVGDLRVELVKYLIVECKEHKKASSFVELNMANETIFPGVVELIILLPGQYRIHDHT